MNKIKVVELFAGVGGFRLGLENASKKYETIWANQWEPSTKKQHAFDIYNYHFNNSVNVNKNIYDVWDSVPKHDFLVGGFPCQDYSVAQGNKGKGINGDKGSLWWTILKIIKKNKPKKILLENVDRILNSPTNIRGRDFAIILRGLSDLGYAIEWKMINAADYGFPQRRKRVFIYAWIPIKKILVDKEYLENKSLLNKVFKNDSFIQSKKNYFGREYYRSVHELSQKYKSGKFLKTGIAYNGSSISCDYNPKNIKNIKILKDILEKKSNFKYLSKEQIKRAEYQKSKKNEKRKTKAGFEYNYSEGKMVFPDCLSKPSRTLLTSEGTISRTSHFILDKNKIRFLTPIETERLNGFPDDWTKGKTYRQRCFFMGNALVTGIITKIGKEVLRSWNE